MLHDAHTNGIIEATIFFEIPIPSHACINYLRVLQGNIDI